MNQFKRWSLLFLLAGLLPVSKAFGANNKTRIIYLGDVLYTEESSKTNWIFAGILEDKTLVMRKQVEGSAERGSYQEFYVLLGASNYAFTVPQEWLNEGDVTTPHVVGQADIYFKNGAVITVEIDNYQRALVQLTKAPR